MRLEERERHGERSTHTQREKLTGLKGQRRGRGRQRRRQWCEEEREKEGKRDGRRWRDGCGESARDRQMKEGA